MEGKKQDLEQDPNVEAVGYNYIDQTMEAQTTGIPNDQYFGLQWGYPRINVPEAWDTTTGNGALIAVLDTGIDASHPDVGGKVTDQWDFVNNDNTANDDVGHGTHVAGTAAAFTNNSTGVSGTAPDADLQIYKVCYRNSSGGGSCNNSAEIAGINRAWRLPKQM